MLCAVWRHNLIGYSKHVLLFLLMREGITGVSAG
jgi:hypothetical protein